MSDGRPYVEGEIRTQPACWRQAAGIAARHADVLPRSGERVAVVGCGTSLFMSQAYAVLREASGAGETDAFPASEMPAGRRYDRVVTLTRSGTTTEVLDLLARLRGQVETTAVTADPETPVMEIADHAVVLDFADERSVVQTRFATTALALLRAHLGADVGPYADAAAEALAAPLPEAAVDREQFVFLGRGWTVGLAHEAALKMREAALAWAESYPAMEYRHGSISVTGDASAVWFLGDPPPGLVDEVARTGALVVAEGREAMAELVRVQRLAVAVAQARSVDPDHPRHLSRSVVLPTDAR